MAHVVVLGAGLGGAIMAYELKEQLRKEDTVTVVTKDPKYHFVPSNPWIAVGWRKRDDITVDLATDRAVVVGNGNVALDVARVLATRLSAELNRSVIVDPTPGGSGLLAARKLLNAPADGTMLLNISPTTGETPVRMDTIAVVTAAAISVSCSPAARLT